ncbi:MAG: arylsulfatase [Planctomycetota bacterium]|jgi:arylsulfatase A-like enzyme
MHARRLALSIVAAAVAAATLAPSEALARDRQPNIIYIMADDLGYGDLSCFGQKKFATPNIDRMAAEGMRFTDHYSGSTVCAPSRCALMTGLHTGHCYVRGNREHRPVGQEPIPAESVTVAELLKRAGYATGCYGKWGLGFPHSPGDPMKQGFDEFYGYNCQRNAHTYYPRHLFHNSEKVALDGKTYSHDLIVEKALAFIRANARRPFYCYMPVAIPHAAMHVPEKYVAPFREKFPQFENKIGRYSGPKVKNPIAAFAGMMVKLDEDVGRVFALLKELGIDDDTVVMFTSDNGPHLEGGHDPRFFDSNGPLTGFKRSLTEGGIRVPMIARWPGKVAPRSTSDHPSAFWDFLPTACEIAGVDAPEGIDGISYVPAMLGQDARQKKHDYLYWEFYAHGGKRAVRMGKWKAIQRNLMKRADDRILLYDLEADLAEKKDVAAQNPEVMARMRAIFKEAHVPSGIWKFKGLQNR